jgi:hypothetical protein
MWGFFFDPTKTTRRENEISLAMVIQKDEEFSGSWMEGNKLVWRWYRITYDRQTNSTVSQTSRFFLKTPDFFLCLFAKLISLYPGHLLLQKK